jgi:tetratricopeptide (TPR) repeat protein
MKNIFLILLLFLLSLNSYAQKKKIADKAFSKYHSGEYQEAIKLYRAKVNQNADLHDRFMLGMCYIKTDSAEQAELAFEKIIGTSGDNQYFEDLKVQACDELAKFYLQRKDYRQALNYYQLYATTFEKARFDDVNYARFHFLGANDQAQCYAGLRLIDSAITVMTPYMFYNYRVLTKWMFVPPNYRNPKDSLLHDSVSRFYVSLLQKRYKNKRIKAEFKKAEQSFTFTETRRPGGGKDFVWENIKCSMDIYGLHIVFLEREIGNKQEQLLKDIQDPYYTRAYQLEQFLHLPLFKMVRDLPDK